MTNKNAKGSWSGVKAALRAADQSDLLAVIRALYDVSPDNRRFLHARFFGPGTELEKYRALILDAMYPNLFGRKPVRVGEAGVRLPAPTRCTSSVPPTFAVTSAHREPHPSPWTHG